MSLPATYQAVSVMLFAMSGKTYHDEVTNIEDLTLKVHKTENFFGSEFEFNTISLLIMVKY